MKKLLPVEARAIAESFEGRTMLSVTPTTTYAPVLHSNASTPAVLNSASKQSPKSARVRAGAPAAAIASAVEGLTANYYTGVGLRRLALVRTDGSIDFNWGAGAPDASLVGKAFSAQWTGQILPQYSETYKFETVADDGVRVWVGGKLVIDDWHNQFATASAGSISLQAGQAYDIKVQYYENGDPPASVRLFWSSASQPRQIVPSSALRSSSVGTPSVGSSVPTAAPTPPAIPAAPVNLTAAADSDAQIELRWNDVAGEKGFIVDRSADGTTGWGAIGAVAAGQTQFTDTGLSASTTYYYRVLATNFGGTSGGSNVASAATLAAPVPVQSVPAPAPLPPIVVPSHPIYGLTNDGAIEQIDTTTATATQIGTLLFGTAAADRDPVSGKFYYIEQGTSTPRVAVWDPATQTNTLLGTVSLTGSVLRAAFRSDGTLFITANYSDLYTIDTQSGAATRVGTIQAHGVPLRTTSGDMAFAADGTLYLEATGLLYSVDSTTLNSTYVGTDGSVGNVQVAFGSDGLLYATNNMGDLYTINLTTGSATLLGHTGVQNIGDLAPAA